MWLRISDEENTLATKALAKYQPGDQHDLPHVERAQLKLAAVMRDRKPSVRLTNKEASVMLDSFGEYDPFSVYEEELLDLVAERVSGRA